MSGAVIGLVIFVCVIGSAIASLVLHPRLPAVHRSESTHNVVKLAVGMIVVMTSLVLTLLMTSAKTSFDQVDRDVRRFSTELILLDRALRAYGPQADMARKALTDYVERALSSTWPACGGPVIVEDRSAGDLLDQAERASRRSLRRRGRIKTSRRA